MQPGSLSPLFGPSVCKKIAPNKVLKKVESICSKNFFSFAFTF